MENVFEIEFWMSTHTRWFLFKSVRKTFENCSSFQKVVRLGTFELIQLPLFGTWLRVPSVILHNLSLLEGCIGGNICL